MTPCSSRQRRARPLLGTLVEISASGSPHQLPVAIERAFAAIEHVQRLMSFHAGDSDVSRLNREGYRRAIRVDPQTWEVLVWARAISHASDGAFDVTVAPRLVDWGYLPRRAETQCTVVQGGYRRIELLPDCGVRFLEPVLIDLGGIAKGYAVDRACAALEGHGVLDYVVNAGGDLRVGRTPETVHVRHPRWPGATLPLAEIEGGALATSGAYFARREHGDRAVHPIVTAETGAPAPVQDSVSVLAPNCLTADALTKVVCVLGERAAGVLRGFGAQACLLPADGELRHLPA
jgi:FAD:protein FMN transferase